MLSNINCQNYYHSEASLPYSSITIKSSFELILNDEKKNPFDFGLIVAKDNDISHYLIFAQLKDARSGGELVDVNFSRVIAVPKNRATELLKLVEHAVNSWKEKYTVTTGESCEFLIAPENKIVPQSQNVVSWYASLKFYYENNEEGPKANLIIGDYGEKKEYSFNELNNMAEFMEMLKKAISKIN